MGGNGPQKYIASKTWSQEQNKVNSWREKRGGNTDPSDVIEQSSNLN
jgi:hypothetical protein